MRILKDNYKIQEKKYPDFLICEHCLSELEYEESDIRIGALGLAYLDCPLCGYESAINDEELYITLTKDNIEFPNHFWHTSEDTGAVDVCNTDNVRKYIKEAIQYFRQNKDEYSWGGHITGNLYIHVRRYDGDEIYEVTISNDFYETDIPFEKEDY